MRLGVKTLDRRCEALRVEFEAGSGERSAQRVSIRGRSEDEPISFGIAALVLPVQGRHGTLRIALDCPIGAKVQLDEIALYRVSMGLYYGAALFEPPAAHSRAD